MMTAAVVISGVVPFAVRGIFTSLAEGTLLAALVWLVVRLVPQRNSGTRFVIWFSTLLAIALLPFLSIPQSILKTSNSVAPFHREIVLAPTVGYSIFYAWLLIATLGLGRVALGLLQVYRLRKSCSTLDVNCLSLEAQKVVEHIHSNSLSVCVSSRVDVPTAIGFSRPAIVIPAWLIEDASPAELEHVLLHEVAHLRRHDDWTNLAQKTVKAIFFFHPFVWWIERKLTLDREIACDDAVLAQTASPTAYAECLTHIAEKSFIRRQIALAQAAVSRVRQLSFRLEQILRPGRPASTRLWKPAIPIVTVLAVVCTVWASRTPQLISFSNETTEPTSMARNASAEPVAQSAQLHNTQVQTAAQSRELLQPREVKFTPSSVVPAPKAPAPTMINAGFSLPPAKHRHVIKHIARKMVVTKDVPVKVAAKNMPAQSPAAIFFRASYILRDGNLLVTREETFYSPDGSASAVQQQSGWKVQILELKLTDPGDQSKQQTIVLII